MKNVTFSPNTGQPYLKLAASILTSMMLVAAAGCTTNVSSKGGVVQVNEEFSITVPATTTVKQGTEATIVVMLNRGAYFKRDVRLELKTDGITVSPKSVLIAASDKPDMQFQIVTSSDTALGDYRVAVTGVPENGKPAATVFVVKVVAPSK